MDRGTSDGDSESVMQDGQVFVETSTWKLENNSDAIIGKGTSSTLLDLVYFLNWVMISTVLWMLINVIVFAKRTKMWKSSSDNTKVDKGSIFIVCVLAITTALPKLILTQLLFYEAMFAYCEPLMDSISVAYIVPVWCVYYFLWLRHRAIYAYPTVKGLLGKYSNCFSWFAIVNLSTISLLLVIYWIYPVDYDRGEIGCILSDRNATTTPGALAFWNANCFYIVGSLQFVGQLIFLILFIWPMIITARLRKGQSDGTSRSIGQFLTCCCGDANGVRTANDRDNISSIMKRAIVCAAIAVFTDILVAVIVGTAFPNTTSRTVTASAYDVGLLINLSCMLANFQRPCRILSSARESLWSRRPSSERPDKTASQT